MQQQHLMQMQPMMAAYYPNNVTTDHIQQVKLPASSFFIIYLLASALSSSNINLCILFLSVQCILIIHDLYVFYCIVLY
jgi:hypothetical protein